MVLDRAAYGREISRRLSNLSFWWELLVGGLAGAIPWAVRSSVRQDVGMPELTDILLAVGVVLVLETIRRWHARRRARYKLYREAAQRADDLEKEKARQAIELDRQLVADFTQQRIYLITELRDKQGCTAANDYGSFTNWQRAVGKWFGRNEYLAEQLRTRFPNEVGRFLVYGDADLQYAQGATAMETVVNHTKAVITAKADRFSLLTAALEDDVRKQS
jgi:hypothetical protein